MTRPTCDACGSAKERARPVTADDRERWPSLAAWVRAVCAPCGKRLDRNAELDRAWKERAA